MKITCLIVDDEELARQGIEIFLKRYTEFEIIDTANNGKAALDLYLSNPVDVIFLDIEMPIMNGLELAHILNQKNPPLIIFTTAYDEFAIKAFRENAIDFLLKPIDPDEFDSTINRIKDQMELLTIKTKQQKINSIIDRMSTKNTALSNLLYSDSKIENNSDIVSIKDGRTIYKIPLASVIYIEAAGDYICVYTDNKMRMARMTIKNAEKDFKTDYLVRIHRSTIININKVKSVKPFKGNYQVTLENGVEKILSKKYKTVLDKIV